MTNVNCKLFAQLFQYHEGQTLQEVQNKATSPRCTFAKNLAQMNAAVENLVYRAENITTNNLVEFEVCLSKAETGATAYSIPDTDYTINHLE